MVLVRTHGGFPRIRRLWEIAGPAALVVEDQWYKALEAGDFTYAVAVPLEDVYIYTGEVQIKPSEPFDAWASLPRLAV